MILISTPYVIFLLASLPLPSQQLYRAVIIKHISGLRHLDLKRISTEERAEHLKKLANLQNPLPDVLCLGGDANEADFSPSDQTQPRTPTNDGKTGGSSRLAQGAFGVDSELNREDVWLSNQQACSKGKTATAAKMNREMYQWTELARVTSVRVRPLPRSPAASREL